MTQASTDGLRNYVADLVDRLDRFAVTILPPNDGLAIELGRDAAGALIVDLQGRLPVGPRSPDVDLDLVERWVPVGPDQFERAGYRFELRHHGLAYRRAFHRHDVDHFVRAYQVATHEHCESTMGAPACNHYFGEPIADGFDAFDRLYDLWLTDAPPRCMEIRCLD